MTSNIRLGRFGLLILITAVTAVTHTAYGQSCVNHCGVQSGPCWCDDACVQFNDCCSNYCQACVVPSIASVTPLSGPTTGGTLLTINGQNFGTAVGTAMLNGVNMTVFSWSATEVKAFTPPGMGLNHPIQIINTCFQQPQQGQSDPMNLFNYEAPFITSVSPTSGATSGGTLLTINGQSFGASPGSATLGGTPMSIQSWNHNEVKAFTPPGVGLNHHVRIQTASGTSNVVPFSYNPPLISNVSPPSGPAAGGTFVTITGNDFGATPGIATLANNAMTVQSWSHTEVTAFTPPGIGLLQPVRIQTASGTSNDGTFNYSARFILNVNPPMGPTTGGTLITISGENFGSAPGTVTLASIPMAVQSWSNLEIQALTPPGVGMNRPVQVNTASGASNLGNFSYFPPFIQTIRPSTGPTSGGTLVTITGTDFGPLPGTVMLAGNPMSVQSWTHNEVRALTPAGAGLNQQVQIQTASGVSNLVSFHYGAPILLQVDPTSGPTAGGTPLTILGENFGSTPGVATLAGVPMSILSWSHTQVIALSPPGVGLNQLVQIQTASGTSNAGLFNFDAPLITGVNPPSGPLSGGTPITISGVNFGPLVGSATLNGLPMPVQSWSHTQIVAILPASCGANLPVIVETPSGTSNFYPFDYEPPYLAGDMTCDCSFDMNDIALFVDALVNPDDFPGCHLMLADLNGDEVINGLDIETFVWLLLKP